MRWRMAAKIAAMNMPPQRIARLTLVLIGLAGAGVWWMLDSASSPPSPAFDGLRAKQTVASSRPASIGGARQEGEAEETPVALEACEQAMRQQRRSRMEALAKAGDTDSRIARALLAMSTTNDPVDDELGTGLSMLKAAAQAAPGDAEAAWYYARYCASDGECDATEATATLVALEPDNLDGWLVALQLAQKRGDEVGVAKALEGGAKARYFDHRNGDSFMRATRALADLPVSPACSTPEYAEFLRDVWKLERQPRAEDFAMAQGMIAAMNELRAYAPLREACSVAKVARLDAGRGSACRSVLQRLSDGDLLIDRLIGETTMVELTADTGDGEHWRERLRKTHWMAEQARSLKPDFDAGMRRWTEGEVPTMQSELAAVAKSLPPADWLPSSERARSLVLTGRPPPEEKKPK